MEQSIEEQYDYQLKNRLSMANTEGIINLRTEKLEPIFVRNKIDYRPTYPITNIVVSNNQLLLSMENFHLLKIDLLNPTKQIEIDLNPYLIAIKAPNRPIISGLFIDKSGQHCLITVGQCLANNNGAKPNVIPFDNFYYHRKLTQLSKMKGNLLTAVGWLDNINPNQQCSNLLIGTSTGRIYETHLQSDDRFLMASRELSFWKYVCDLSSSTSSSQSKSLNFIDNNVTIDAGPSTAIVSNSIDEPICSIQIFRLKNPNEFCILIATRNFIYQYLNKITQQQQPLGLDTTLISNSMVNDHQQLLDGQPYLYQIIQNPNSIKTFKEMPGYIERTRLDVYQASNSTNSMSNNYPSSFAWLTEPGIFYGEIPKLSSATESNVKFFDKANVIMYSDLKQSMNDSKSSSEPTMNEKLIPKSLILTKFHLLLLYGRKLLVYCVLNNELIFEDKFTTGEQPIDLIKDPICNTIWVYTKQSVYQYRINQEDRNIWQIYLRKKDFEMAKYYCRNDLLKIDQTICAEAMHYFNIKDYKKSAKLFTQTRSKTFEEITLKFIELRADSTGDHRSKTDQSDALNEFLWNKLQLLTDEHKNSNNFNDESVQTQLIILLLWLFESYLNRLANLKSSIQQCKLDSPIDFEDDSFDFNTDNHHVNADDQQHDNSMNLKQLENEYENIENFMMKKLISNRLYRPIYQNNSKIFYNLLLNHNNSELYEYFAKEINDFDCLLEFYCIYKCKNDENTLENYHKALQLLKNEECLQLYYRYSPIIVKYLPKQLIDCLIPLANELDMKKLIPSLVHFDQLDNNLSESIDDDVQRRRNELQREQQCKEIIRFLEFCIYDLKSRESLIHNCYLALIVQYEPEKLIQYLNDITQNQQQNLKTSNITDDSFVLFQSDTNDNDQSSIPFDLIYATRICLQQYNNNNQSNDSPKKNIPIRALVQLLLTMGAYEEAIEQALSVNDVKLAKQMANQIQSMLINDSNGPNFSSNQDLAKRLWLKIAKYVIDNLYSTGSNDDSESNNSNNNNANFDITMATNILNECSLLKIEDILPYFPEYLTIDHFKMAICQSLEDYNDNIESLRDDMKLATESAQQIRTEILRLRNRFVIIDPGDCCYFCKFPAINEHFFSFPSCGHLFHYKCLLKEIIDYLDSDRRIQLECLMAESKSIQNQLQTLSSSASFVSSNRQSNEISAESSITLTNQYERIQEKIENLIGNECLLCGNLMIETIDKPFIDPMANDSREQIHGWI